MERAGRLIRGLKIKGSGAVVSHEDLARAAWPVAVGKKIAAHCGLIYLFSGRMVVEVEDEVWKSQLTTLQVQIRNRVDEIVGSGIVYSIEFRVMVRRRDPGRATAPDVTDEAASIADPVLRRLYVTSRRKAASA
jgi:Dna[CI] antecedent, DciA